MLNSILLSIALCTATTTEAEHCNKIWYTNWKGLNYTHKEHVLPNGSRVDFMTDTYAIEVDFCRKWEEAVGQSLFYAIATHRKPAIILLKAGKEDDEDYLMCLAVCEKYGITLYVYPTK